MAIDRRDGLSRRDHVRDLGQLTKPSSPVAGLVPATHVLQRSRHAESKVVGTRHEAGHGAVDQL
jgi:hypothetical protein